MDDAESRLIHALDLLNEVADGLTAERAAAQLDDASLQVFWREWPRTSAWAGALWRQLNTDLEQSSRPAGDPELDETGDAG